MNMEEVREHVLKLEKSKDPKSKKIAKKIRQLIALKNEINKAILRSSK